MTYRYQEPCDYCSRVRPIDRWVPSRCAYERIADGWYVALCGECYKAHKAIETELEELAEELGHG